MREGTDHRVFADTLRMTSFGRVDLKLAQFRSARASDADVSAFLRQNERCAVVDVPGDGRVRHVQGAIGRLVQEARMV